MWQDLLYNIILCNYFINVNSEWVEIPQVTNTQTTFKFGVPTSFPVTTESSFTTSSNYEILMKTPTLRSISETTTLPYLNLKSDVNQNQESFVNSTLKEKNLEKNLESATYSEFSSLLDNIQRTLIQGAGKSFKNKLSVLKTLRDHLLSNIDRQLTSLWYPNNNVESRGQHDDYEMDFPSNEGALMTIGFLTFAVFLIKLVLKLIHALKSKSNNGNQMMMTTMSPTAVATAYIGRRKKREIENQDAMEILKLIEEYNFT